MALLTKKEFSDSCEIETKALSVYISRNKVILSAGDLIDDSNPMNKLFREKSLSKPKKPKPEAGAPETTSSAPPEPKKKKAKEKDEPDKFDERFELDSEKKKMEIEKLRRESRLADMQHEKAIGRLVPTDPVKTLFMQTIKAYTMSFKQGSEKILSEFGKRAKLSRNDMAEIRASLIDIINKASEEGISESKKSVMNIVREYAQTKKV